VKMLKEKGNESENEFKELLKWLWYSNDEIQSIFDLNFESFNDKRLEDLTKLLKEWHYRDLIKSIKILSIPSLLRDFLWKDNMLFLTELFEKWEVNQFESCFLKVLDEWISKKPDNSNFGHLDSIDEVYSYLLYYFRWIHNGTLGTIWNSHTEEDSAVKFSLAIDRIVSGISGLFGASDVNKKEIIERKQEEILKMLRKKSKGDN
jgi:hypothetical protein